MIALQETKYNKPDKRQSAEYFVHTSDPTARCFWSHTTSPIYNGRHGVGLVMSTTSPFRDPVDVSRSVMNPTLQNRYLLVQSVLGENPIYIHVVYAPDEPAQRGEFFRALPKDFAPEAEHIVVGDFNVTLDDNLDQRVPGHQAGVGREELRDWLLDLGLIDAWRFHHPDKREYTSPKDRNRIDFCFLSVRLLQGHLQDISHVIGPKWQHEDHKPVDFLLSSVNVPRTKAAPWRCPTWLLRDSETVDYLQASVEKLADRIRVFNGANPGCLLDEHKRSDSKWLRKRFTTLHNADTEEHKRLHKRLQDFKLQFDIRPTPANLELCTSAKLALKAYQEAIQFRNQRRKFEADLHQSEKTTKYFFTKPVPDALRVPIPGVKLEDGSTSSDPVVIAEVQRRYWGKLFQSPSEDLKQRKAASYSPIDLAKYLHHTVARLTDSQRSALDAPMTANDFYWAIRSSKNDKAPGPDGLPVEYYKVAASAWAWIYEAVYASQLEKGRMTKFQRRAHLSLLYKAGDRCEPSNYRPLTLLNHDAKFGPKILARRLGDVLPSIVDNDQSGFVPGRSIRHALIRFQDIQRYCQEHHSEAGAILLDFAKAFDSVLWPALDMVLQHFGFGDTFRDWVKTFYSGTLVSILVSGAPGRPFELGAGVRQGDPLSPGLFVVFIEPMLNFLRSRLHSVGVKIGNTDRHLTIAFADDCTGLLENLRDAPQFLETVRLYSRAAGLKLNVAKTNILPFSRQVQASTLETLSSLGVKVVSARETVKLLGVLQGATVTPEERFAPILQQMRQRCILWKYRARTLQGRVVILQSVILPLLWYTASVTVVPKAVLTAADVIIRNFVNNNDQALSAAPGKLPKEWIHVSKPQGGLGLVKPSVFTRASHLTCLRDGVRSTAAQHRVPRWFEPALHFFNSSLQGLGYGFDILYADIPKTRTRTSQWSALPEYWYETLLTWRRLHEVAGVSHRGSTSQVMPLWSNFWYLFGSTNRPAHKLSKHNVSLISKGYLRLQDFVDRHSSLPTAAVLTSILEDYDGFARPASQTLFVNETVRRFQLLPESLEPRNGPNFPRQVEAAHHPWTFSCRTGSDTAFIRMTNADFSKILGGTVVGPEIPYAQLSVEAPSNMSNVWKQDFHANRHLLPVFADLKFRLQHNALGFRYKFKWHTDVVLASTCVHGCEADENAKHLFWDCAIAKHQWEWYLRPLISQTSELLTWKDVLFADSVMLKNEALKDIGAHNFGYAFNIIRGCVMRTLWLHRNNKMYNPEVSSSALFVQHHASNYVELHLKWLHHFASEKSLRRLQRWCESVLSQLGLSTTLGTNPIPNPLTPHR